MTEYRRFPRNRFFPFVRESSILSEDGDTSIRTPCLGYTTGLALVCRGGLRYEEFFRLLRGKHTSAQGFSTMAFVSRYLLQMQNTHPYLADAVRR